MNTQDVKYAHKPQKYFWDLRIFIISLLQDRAYPLWQRLVILGLFCSRVTELVGDGKAHDIPEIIRVYQNRVKSGIYGEELNAVPSNLIIQMELMNILVNQRVSMGVNNLRFLECFKEFQQGIYCMDKVSKEEIAERYAEAYTKFYQPLVDQHEYILENYLVNYVFRSLFPFYENRTIFDNYVMLVVNITMIKMLLVGMASFHREGFAVDHLIKAIQAFTKVIEHDQAYLTTAFRFIKDNSLNTMPYMAVLIKN